MGNVRSNFSANLFKICLLQVSELLCTCVIAVFNFFFGESQCQVTYQMSLDESQVPSKIQMQVSQYVTLQ